MAGAEARARWLAARLGLRLRWSWAGWLDEGLWELHPGWYRVTPREELLVAHGLRLRRGTEEATSLWARVPAEVWPSSDYHVWVHAALMAGAAVGTAPRAVREDLALLHPLSVGASDLYALGELLPALAAGLVPFREVREALASAPGVEEYTGSATEAAA